MSACKLYRGLAWNVWVCACLIGACSDDRNVLGVIVGSTPGGDASSSDSGAAPNPAYMLGADISSVQQAVAGGATYYDDDGKQKDILTLLAAHGFNYIRLRTFVDPTQAAPNPQGGTFSPYSTQGYCDLAHTVTFGQRVKAAGMGFLLDFHYSDTWADPGKQVKPAVWANDDLPTLVTALHDYTLNAISTLVNAGARPDMVQLGNDITPGIELTPGTAMGPTSNWNQLAQLLNAGIRAVHSVDSTIKIMLHIDRCADPASSIAFVTGAMSNGVAFDVLGESCYTAYQGRPSAWQTTFSALVSKFPNLEFAMAQYNADSTNAAEIRQANDIVFNLPNHRGLGTFFWEPTESGAWGPGLFTVSGNGYSTIPARIDPFDQIKAAYGF
jgi:arabinogalactan endo-1,4-beta-galactosidase